MPRQIRLGIAAADAAKLVDKIGATFWMHGCECRIDDVRRDEGSGAWTIVATPELWTWTLRGGPRDGDSIRRRNDDKVNDASHAQGGDSPAEGDCVVIPLDDGTVALYRFDPGSRDRAVFDQICTADEFDVKFPTTPGDQP